MIHPLTEEAAGLIAGRFRALSDPTRLRIVDTLRDRGEASVSELTEALGTSQQNVSKHLTFLHAEGFVAVKPPSCLVVMPAVAPVPVIVAVIGFTSMPDRKLPNVPVSEICT